jgi:16S rRNA A1518/A1519 N6-dimethyltransferase RsmA/KsgA/DIM1 with predicted DNA glycosylase/AP lyase activity
MLEKTIKYIQNIDLEYRKKNGQFFTSNELVKETLNFLNIKKNDIVLEPSFGTGEFIVELRNKTNNLYGVEKDKKLFFPYNDNFFNEDFLL